MPTSKYRGRQRERVYVTTPSHGLGLAFIVLNYHRFMGFYYTPYLMALLGMRDLVHGPRPQKNYT